MPHFAKPAEGSWTEHYPQLGTAPVSYEDSITPEYYERERDAIFARTWLNVGRIEQLPRVGSYFTKEIDAARTSIVVVRSADQQVRAFYNMCRHRGNKLVWQDYPDEEVAGTCRQFQCKYHGWRYSLEGDLTFVQQEGEFFDLDKADYGLAPVRVETWEGFIFVNLDQGGTTPLREYLGELGRGLEGYPFGEMTQVYKYRAEVGSNWKLFIDAFTEFYHAPVLHARQAVSEESAKLAGYGYEALAYEHRRSARHGVVVGRDVAAEGPQHGQADRARAAQRAVRTVGGADRHRPAAGGEPGARRSSGASTRSCSSRTSWCWSGSRTGTSRTTTGRRRTTATSSRARCTSCRLAPRVSDSNRSSRR